MKRMAAQILVGLMLAAGLGWAGVSYVNQGLIFDLVHGDVGAFVAQIRAFGAWAAVILVLLVVLEVVLAPVPPLVLYVAAGVLFGTLEGGLLVLLGNVLGAVIAFYIARTFARDYFAKKIDPALRERFDSLANRYGSFAIVLLRINPLTSSDLFSYLAGLSGMSPWRFALATTVGLTPLVFVQTYLGADVVGSNPLLMTLFVVLSVLYVVGLVGVLVYVRLRRRVGV